MLNCIVGDLWMIVERLDTRLRPTVLIEARKPPLAIFRRDASQRLQ